MHKEKKRRGRPDDQACRDDSRSHCASVPAALYVLDTTQRSLLTICEANGVNIHIQLPTPAHPSLSPTSTVGSEFFVVFVDKPFVPGDISLSALNSDECMKYFT